ncbi:MAG TPA: hypothetical protein VKE51_26620 [Vicinamibacterales bacterium]|nr:hypothetical protein [Vicinamibacterales bacterium]
MIEIVTGFALGYGVPMFLLNRYLARQRAGATAPRQTVADRAA